MISRLIGGGVVVAIGFSLIPEISKQVQKASINLTSSNSTYMASTILRFIPGLFALAILGVGVAVVVSAIRDSGITDEYEEDYEEEIKKNPDKKQTYKEYVKERLEVENMLK